MPDTIDAAAETARKLEAVELAHKRLYRERMCSDQVTTATLAQVTVIDSVQDKLDRLTADVQRLTEQMSSLTGLKLEVEEVHYTVLAL